MSTGMHRHPRANRWAGTTPLDFWAREALSKSGSFHPNTVPTRVQNAYSVTLKCFSLLTFAQRSGDGDGDGHSDLGLLRSRHPATVQTHRKCLRTSKSPLLQRP